MGQYFYMGTYFLWVVSLGISCPLCLNRLLAGLRCVWTGHCRGGGGGKKAKASTCLCADPSSLSVWRSWEPEELDGDQEERPPIQPASAASCELRSAVVILTYLHPSHSRDEGIDTMCKLDEMLGVVQTKQKTTNIVGKGRPTQHGHCVGSGLHLLLPKQPSPGEKKGSSIKREPVLFWNCATVSPQFDREELWLIFTVTDF